MSSMRDIKDRNIKEVLEMKYILWLNHGLEGWSPNEFKTLDELLAALKRGETYGNEFKITKELQLEIKIIEE